MVRLPRDRSRLAWPWARVALLLAAALILLASPLGCAGRRSGGPGVIHHVRSGENLYRIGLRYGVTSKQIAKANGIRDVTSLRPGQRLYIPGARRRRSEDRRTTALASRGSGGAGNLEETRRRAREAARRQSALQFVWPLRGRLSSRFGMRSGRAHEGIDVAASRGTPIFAAEAGRVIHSGRLGSYGKVVIVKHTGAYRTVYAHASKLLVRKGAFVERGQKIALVGSTGRSSGPHLHFEIRRSETPQNPLAFLP